MSSVLWQVVARLISPVTIRVSIRLLWLRLLHLMSSSITLLWGALPVCKSELSSINMWSLPLTVNFSNGTNCLASTLNDIQSANGPLTLNSLIQLVTLGNVPNIPSNVTCSDCTKAAYNILRSDVPSIVSDTSGELQQQCGANFTGKTTIRMDEMKINDCCNSFRH